MNTALKEKLSEFEKIGTAQSVVLLTPAGKAGNGVAYIHEWKSGERKWRALKTLVIVWGLAILAIFIPIAHFFLVPLLLILGPILAASAYGQRSVILGGEGTCPQCGKPVEIVRAKDAWPLQDICSDCGQNVIIQKK